MRGRGGAPGAGSSWPSRASPSGQARGEIGATETFLRYAAEWARRIEGEILPSDAPQEEVWIRRLPHGVVAGLTAWNYPSALATRKLGPALVAGNAFVLKAHEFTPLSGLALAALAERVGLPKGLVNVVTGDGRNVGARAGRGRGHDLHDRLDPRGARDLRDGRRRGIKNLRLELGGKAPFIVMEDADIAPRGGRRRWRRASPTAGRSAPATSGCTSTRPSRTSSWRASWRSPRRLTIGPGMEDPDLGPKISGGEVEKVEAMTAASIEAGAEVLLRGGPLTRGALRARALHGAHGAGGAVERPAP